MYEHIYEQLPADKSNNTQKNCLVIHYNMSTITLIYDKRFTQNKKNNKFFDSFAKFEEKTND